MLSAVFSVVVSVLGLLFLIGPLMVPGQSRTNSTGTGGINQIRGRIYLPNGKALESPITVELQSTTFGTLNLQTDRSGSFQFSGLNPGSYTVIINAGESFETVREFITIDPEVQTSTIRVTPIPKTFTVPIYLQLKRSVALRNEIINAKYASYPKDAIDHYNKGMNLSQAEKLDEAVVEFRNAIASYPAFTASHVEIGKIKIRTGKLDEAVAALVSALKIEPESFDARLNLGIAFLNLKKFDQAEPEFVTAAYINRTAVTPHYYLGVMYIEKRDLNVAQKALETARGLAGDKGFPLLHKYLGGVYLEKGLNKKALAELEIYLNLSPQAKDADRIRQTIAELKKKQD